MRAERGRNLSEIWNNDSNIVWAIRAIDHALKYKLTSTDGIFQRDGGDIFPVLKLVEFFDSTSDLEESVVHNHTEVTGMKKA